jgi:transcriptional regulator with XRE-family HTH domain
MKRSAYREHDYAFGQRMLTLRSALGLTQAGLAQALGVSRRSVADWEAGNKYPKAAHLTQLIALALKHQVFHVGHEAEEIRALWRAAHQKVLLDDVWLSDLLSQVQAAPVSPDVETASAMAARDLRADVPPLRLAGKRDVDEPRPILPAFLSAAPPQPGPPAPFVAREQELTELSDALMTARNGAGQILFVIGGAGRGKTWLLQEFARRALAADAELLVVSGSCNAHTGSGDPYLPFREVLTMLCGDVETRWAGGLISTEHARRLWEAMPLTLPALVEHAPDLLGTFVPGKSVRERAATFAERDVSWFRELVARESAEVGARVAQQPIFTQYSAALGAIARERPLVLILEQGLAPQ